MTPYDGCVRPPVRGILRLEGVLLLAALVYAYYLLHASWIVFAVLILTPDVAMVAYARGTRLGAWAYNAFHSYAGPVVLAVFSIYARAWLPIALIWAAHVAMDRALGYGLKYEDAFTHTHLGRLDRRNG